MKKLDKRILDAQIDVFLEWSRRQGGQVREAQHEYLYLFATHSEKTDVLDVNEEDIERFLTLDVGRFHYSHRKEDARKALTKLTRFYEARGRNGKTRLTRGRPPHIGEIAKTQEYRKMGLTLKDISKLMGKPLSLVHRWTKYRLKDRLE